MAHRKKPGEEGDRLETSDLVLEGGSPQRPPVEGEMTRGNERQMVKADDF